MTGGCGERWAGLVRTVNGDYYRGYLGLASGRCISGKLFRSVVRALN